jgi:hypothetical protein
MTKWKKLVTTIHQILQSTPLDFFNKNWKKLSKTKNNGSMMYLSRTKCVITLQHRIKTNLRMLNYKKRKR